MILVIYPSADKGSINFINYLEQNNLDHLALEINNDILNPGLQIVDKGEGCIWNVKGKEIDFKKVSGIYNRVHYLDYASFLDYETEDVEYVQREWWAYLFYRMEVTKNCINPPSSELLSGLMLDFTYFYTLGQKIGFKVPEYFLSTSYDELKNKFNDGKKYIALNNLFLNNKFAPSKNITDNTIALIEHIKGEIVLSHIVQDNIYTCSIEGKEKIDIELDKKTLQLCHKFRASLNVRVMQIIFIKKDEELFLMNISAFPNWDYNSSSNKQKIYKHLISILS